MVRVKHMIILLNLLFIGCNTVLVNNKTEDKKYYNIDKYIDFSVKLSSDTLFWGDTLSVDISFKNRTDTTVYFYPRGLLYIDRYIHPDIFPAGDDITSYFLNLYADTTTLIKLEPYGVYSMIYKLSGSLPLFQVGANKLQMSYVCRNFPPKAEIEQKILYGYLVTYPFEVLVKK